GAYVPLSEQDVALWSRALIDDAERELAVAATRNAAGRFQLEAAIQSVHAHRAVTGRTDWDAIALFYEALVQHTGALGARVGRSPGPARSRGGRPHAPPSRTGRCEPTCSRSSARPRRPRPPTRAPSSSARIPTCVRSCSSAARFDELPVPRSGAGAAVTEN